MRILPLSVACLTLFATAASAQTSLTRSEVTALKAKIVTVRTAMGAEPAGYLQEGEDEFDLPTDANPARGGKFWPIGAGVSMRYTDRAEKEAEANLERLSAEMQTKMTAAIAAGRFQDIQQLTAEMTRAQTAATNPADKKEPMNVNVRFNQNPTVGIDPDAVVLERAGVIVLRDANGDDGQGDVTAYIDPVALRATEELSKIELRTDDEGMPLKAGVYHVVIQLNGTLADAEAWAQKFDFGAMLGVIDAR